jgi:hypothetical protein
VARRKKGQVSGTQALGMASGVWIGVAILSGAWIAWVIAGAFTLTTVGVVARRHRPKARPPARGRGRTPASGRARRGKGRKPKQAPLTGHNQRPGKLAALAPVRCSAACRTSRKPAYNKSGQLTCDCPCGGREHGRYRVGTNANLRHTRTPEEKRRARQAAAEVGRATRRAVSRQRPTGTEAAT